MISRRLLPAALFLAAFCAARADQQWVEVDSPHFSVATDGGEKRAREVALRFEQMRIAFGALFQKINVNTAPLQIIAFRNSKGLRQFAPLYDGKPIELSGYFLGNGGHGGRAAGGERQYIALDLSADDDWGTVFHEYAHLLINSNSPPLPVWFDEGFAEYCSSLKVDKKEIVLGLVRPELPAALRQNRWLPLVDLFSVSHNSRIYNRDDRRSLFYAQSWITVYFFMSKNMMKQVNAYMVLSQNQHVPVPESIRRAFGMEPPALEKMIADYFRTDSSTSFHTAAPPGSDRIPFTSHPLNDLDVKSVFADLDYHTHDYRQRGIKEFEEILARQPDNVVANRGLGYEALEKNDWEQAGEYFKRAAAGDVKDPQVHYLLALMLSRRSMGTGNTDSAEEIKKELSAALALDPNYAEAYNLLGITLSHAGAKDEAVAALTKAMALSPRNPGYAANLANAYMRSQDFDHAIPLLQELEKSSDPRISGMAAQQLRQVESLKSFMVKQGASGHVQVAVESEESDSPSGKPEQHPASTPSGPVLFMKGTLVSVDCSNAPAAILIISSAGKKWKMLAPQAKKLIVMGADELSCSWINRKVAVNYRKSGDDEGSVLSLELQ